MVSTQLSMGPGFSLCLVADKVFEFLPVLVSKRLTLQCLTARI